MDFRENSQVNMDYVHSVHTYFRIRTIIRCIKITLETAEIELKNVFHNLVKRDFISSSQIFFDNVIVYRRDIVA